MINLTAKIRKERNTDSGTIPAVLYGPGIENISLEINKKEIEKVFKEVGETLVDLDIDGKKYSVLIHDTQLDPITLELIHVDLYQPNLKEKVEADVHLELVGEAPAVKLGGTLITNIKELTVKALPKDLPSKITIDVSQLNEMNSSISIKDIKLPEGANIVTDNPEEIIVQIVAPEDVDKELAEPIEGINKEPEKVETKKKEEVEDKE
ncbi:MAG: 50S ribosomal protein L25 [Candidatus Pacebacteria bacterium]|nr:50S ribosomal protein L25 [Candidatus Paceibacterota bacterium]MDD4074368.1 50S ribosomal protein L25 [Candidatus Paceibacterota bacterium]